MSVSATHTVIITDSARQTEWQLLAGRVRQTRSFPRLSVRQALLCVFVNACGEGEAHGGEEEDDEGIAEKLKVHPKRAACIF